MTYGPTALDLFLDLPHGGAIRGTKAMAVRPEPDDRSLGRNPMLRTLHRLRARFTPPPFGPVEPDPIDHPAFRGMSPRELADLPFPHHSMSDVAEGQASSPLPSSP